MKCSKCPVETGSPASIMCPDCHAKEVARVHAHDTPDVPSVPDLRPYGLPMFMWNRPHSSGRRIFRNEKAQQ